MVVIPGLVLACARDDKLGSGLIDPEDDGCGNADCAEVGTAQKSRSSEARAYAPGLLLVKTAR